MDDLEIGHNDWGEHGFSFQGFKNVVYGVIAVLYQISPEKLPVSYSSFRSQMSQPLQEKDLAVVIEQYNGICCV